MEIGYPFREARSANYPVQSGINVVRAIDRSARAFVGRELREIDFAIITDAVVWVAALVSVATGRLS